MARGVRIAFVVMVCFASSWSGMAQRGADTMENQYKCANTCHEIDCDKMSIRYGKFCGVGHGGCEGEKPCDAIDGCCKRHDTCVEEAGILGANKCHKSFLVCLEKNKGKGDGFSIQCPYSVVVPAMSQGIKFAMMFTSMAGGDEL